MTGLVHPQPRQLVGHVGITLRALRQAKAWSLHRLQVEMWPDEEDEKSWQTLRAYERGERKVSLKTFLIWCDALEQHPGELLIDLMGHSLGVDWIPCPAREDSPSNQPSVEDTGSDRST